MQHLNNGAGNNKNTPDNEDCLAREVREQCDPLAETVRQRKTIVNTARLPSDQASFVPPKYGETIPADAPDRFTILFVGANDSDGVQLALENECQDMELDFQRHHGERFRDRVRFIAKLCTRADDLMRHIRQNSPTVLHFACHGTHTSLRFLEAEANISELASALEAYQRGANPKIRLAVANACLSDSIAETLAQHIDFVIGHCEKLVDQVACKFTSHFYECLGRGDWSLKGCYDQSASLVSSGKIGSYRLFSPRVNPDQFYLFRPLKAQLPQNLSLAEGFWDFELSVAVDELAQLPAACVLHGFISYYADTESVGTNDVAYQLWRELNLASLREGLPQVGQPGWPNFCREPTQLRGINRVAKVFLDQQCLVPGQRHGWWVYAQAVTRSLVMVAVVSLHDSNCEYAGARATGSLAAMCRMKDSDTVPVQVLLEWMLALELMEFEHGIVQAIVPVFLGGMPNSAAEGFTQALEGLPDFPHQPTVDLAAQVLAGLGLPASQLERMRARSVRETVKELLRFEGVSFADHRSHHDALAHAAQKVLDVMHTALETMQSSQAEFDTATPQGEEVLEWLQTEGLTAWAEIFAAQKLDSVHKISKLGPEEFRALFELRSRHRKWERETVGDSVDLATAVTKLQGNPSAQPLGKRLDEHVDGGVSAFTAMVSKNGLEMAMSCRFPCAAMGVAGALLFGVGINGIVRYASDADSIYLNTFPGTEETLKASDALETGFSLVSGPFLLWTVTMAGISPRLKKVNLRRLLVAWAAVQSLSVVLDTVQLMQANCPAKMCYGGYGQLMLALCLWVLCLVLVTREDFFWILLFFVATAFFLQSALIYWYRVENSYEWVARAAHSLDETLPQSIAVPPLFFGLVTLLYKLRSITRNAAIRIALTKDKYNRAWEETLASPPGTTSALLCLPPRQPASPEVHQTASEKRDRSISARVGAGGSSELGAARGAARGHAASALASLTARCNDVDAMLRTARAGRMQVLWMPWLLQSKRRAVQPDASRFSRDGKFRQASGDIERLFLQAVQVNQLFHDLVWRLVQECPDGGSTPVSEGGQRCVPEIVRGPVKHPQRAIEKVVRCYQRDAACLTDIVRCTVVCNDVQHVCDLLDVMLRRGRLLGACAEGPCGSSERRTPPGTSRPSAGHARSALHADSALFRVVSLKNRFDPDNNQSQRSGYRDLCVNLEVGWRTAAGVAKLVPLEEWGALGVQTHICEVQVHVIKVYTVKQEAGNHQVYTQWRNLLSR